MHLVKLIVIIVGGIAINIMMKLMITLSMRMRQMTTGARKMTKKRMETRKNLLS